MKKIIGLILAAAFIPAVTISASAVNSTGGSTVITTTVEASYTVTIPANTEIQFNALSSPIGNVAVTVARLEAGKQLTVSASSSGKLSNTANRTETISYTLKNGSSAFTSAVFTAPGSKALTVDIAQSEWDTAAAGAYSDTITFTVSYGST